MTTPLDAVPAAAVIPESVYYARQLRLPGFNEATQQKLRSARVLIVGVGGLGCPAAMYLAGAGVGTIGLCDADEVSATNLHRQVLFDVTSIGQKKVDVAARKLRAMNPHIRIETFAQFASASSLDDLVKHFDLVLDGTDNFAAKYAINDACENRGVPLVYGSIFQFEGQVSVFHHPSKAEVSPHPSTDEVSQSPCTAGTGGFSYRDLYPNAPPTGLTQNCGEAGVIGVLPGIIGTLQANEAIKVLTGLGETLAGFLFVFNALDSSARRLVLNRRRDFTQGDDAEAGPAAAAAAAAADAIEISSRDLRERLKVVSSPVTWVDVRETSERDAGSIGGHHIPLASLPARLGEIPAAGEIVLYCQSGARSAKAALYLRSVMPARVIHSMQGGLDAWQQTASR